MAKSIPKKQITKSQLQLNYDALKEENFKLQKQIAKLEAKMVTLSSKITILKENTNDRCIHETLPIDCIEKGIIETEKQIKQSEENIRKIKKKITKVSS